MIEILCADLASADTRLYEVLYDRASPGRKDRADRLRRQEDKLHCVVAEALLRKVLGTDAYEIRENNFGKPCIQGREDFHYNISHSGRYVVIAWGDSEVGVDVEAWNFSANLAAIARRFFTPGEQTYVREDPRRFYEVWTKKESYLKFIGKGLHQDLRSFNVLEPEPGIRYYHWTPEGGYSLSLCAIREARSPEFLDAEQLLSGNT